MEAVTNLLYLIRGSQNLSVKKYIDTAERGLRRVSLIANQTLAFHKQSTKRVPASCYDLIGDSLAMFIGRVLNNRIKIEKRKRAEHTIDCLDGEIRHVLNNLIGTRSTPCPWAGVYSFEAGRPRIITPGKEGWCWRSRIPATG